MEGFIEAIPKRYRHLIQLRGHDMMMRCGLRDCKKWICCKSTSQIKNHLDSKKHKDGVQFFDTISETIHSPIEQDLSEEDKFFMRLIKRCIFGNISFNSIIRTKIYEDDRYNHLITDNVYCIIKHLPSLHDYVLQGVKEIIGNNPITIHQHYELEEEEGQEEVMYKRTEEPLNIILDGFTNQRKKAVKYIGTTSKYNLLLDTEYPTGPENKYQISCSLSRVVQKYNINVSGGQVSSVVHDSAANMCSGVKLFLKGNCENSIGVNCNFHLCSIHYNLFIKAIPCVFELLSFLNILFPSTASSRIGSWQDHLKDRRLRLPLPSVANVTRKMIGWSNNLAWCLTETGEEEETALDVLFEWLGIRVNEENSDKVNEINLFNFLEEQSVSFLKTLIRMVANVTNPIALMVKVCQSETSPANHLVLDYYEKATKFFKVPAKGWALDPTTRRMYQGLEEVEKKVILSKFQKAYVLLHEKITFHYNKYILPNKKFLEACRYLNIYSNFEVKDYTLESLQGAIFFADRVTKEEFNRFKRTRDLAEKLPRNISISSPTSAVLLLIGKIQMQLSLMN